jgi:hypothetical protein
MKSLLVFAVTSACLLLSSTLAANETYVCLYGNSERTIKVVYATPDSKIPCDVVYEKDSGSQVMWNAQNMEGYCETKADEFVEKQRGWGWDCAKMEEETPGPAPAATTPAPTPVTPAPTQ